MRESVIQNLLSCRRTLEKRLEAVKEERDQLAQWGMKLQGEPNSFVHIKSILDAHTDHLMDKLSHIGRAEVEESSKK